MYKTPRKILLSVTSTLLLFAGIASAQVPKTRQPAPKAVAKAAKAVTPSRKGGTALGKSESLSGTLLIVDQADKLVVVVGSNGVPYDFKVAPSTQIKVAGKRASFEELAGQVNKTAVIEFTPRNTGNFARSIVVSGG